MTAAPETVAWFWKQKILEHSSWKPGLPHHLGERQHASQEWPGGNKNKAIYLVSAWGRETQILFHSSNVESTACSAEVPFFQLVKPQIKFQEIIPNIFSSYVVEK